MKLSWTNFKYLFLAIVGSIVMATKFNKDFAISLLSFLEQVHPAILVPACMVTALFFGYCMLSGPRFFDYIQQPRR